MLDVPVAADHRGIAQVVSTGGLALSVGTTAIVPPPGRA